MNKKILLEIDKYLSDNDDVDGDEIIDIINNGLMEDDTEVFETNYEKATQILENVYKYVSSKKKLEIINEALEVCDECFLAHIERAKIEKNEYKKINIARSAIDIADKVCKINVEDFEGYMDLEKYMDYLKALKYLGELYLSKERIEEAIEIFEKMLYIDCLDVNRIRHYLIPLYCLNNEDNKALSIIDAYSFEKSTHMLFNCALVYYRVGHYDKALDYLEKAKNANRHVIGLLLDVSKIFSSELSPSYKVKSKDEALDYCIISYRAWLKTKGIIDTLLEFQNSGKYDSNIIS